jgi:hypothetical protein
MLRCSVQGAQLGGISHRNARRRRSAIWHARTAFSAVTRLDLTLFFVYENSHAQTTKTRQTADRK